MQYELASTVSVASAQHHARRARTRNSISCRQRHHQRRNAGPSSSTSVLGNLKAHRRLRRPHHVDGDKFKSSREGTRPNCLEAAGVTSSSRRPASHQARDTSKHLALARRR